MPTYSISVPALMAIIHAAKIYVYRTPKRWDCVAEFVCARQETINEHGMVHTTVGNGRGQVIFSSKEHCKAIYECVHELHLDMLCDLAEFGSRFLTSRDGKNAHKPSILLPEVKVCFFCNKRFTIEARASFPLVYTADGTFVAASYNGRCAQCKVTYFHSFCDKKSAADTFDRCYYDFAASQEYFLVSPLTAFQMRYLQHAHYQLSVAAVPFESLATIYNELNEDKDNITLASLSNFKRHGCSDWRLNDERLEEAWFLWQLSIFMTSENRHLQVSYLTTSHRRNIEGACAGAMDIMLQSPTDWLEHQCGVRGCKEGYVTIDGNEKLRRPICSAPRKSVRLGKSMPRILQCCPNSPVRGNQSRQPSKYCTDHQKLTPGSNADSATNDHNGHHIVVTIDLKTLTSSSRVIQESTVDLPENKDDNVLVGCKAKVDKFYTTTAGILAMVKPCGIITAWSEMYTCESPSQVFAFLLRNLCGAFEHVNFIGYDRGCELKPFLQNLAKKDNKGAKLILDNVDFLVDIFHVIKHKKDTCMPLEDNPKCEYHPHLDKFKKIHGRLLILKVQSSASNG